MSVNLASGLSAITTDSFGVNHIVWVENNVIWHAVYDANAGTWVDAQQVVSGVPDNITSLNLVANQSLIQVSGDETASGLAVIWEQGDVNNNSNFFYTAATYDSSANLQWLETPQQLTVNENSNGETFVNLKPQAIADNNGNVFVVGQQVNLNQAADQSIREDADLYYSQFTVNSSDFPPSSPDSLAAPYTPPVVIDGVNQGTTSLSTSPPQPTPAAYSAFTSLEASSAAATANSSNASSSWGVSFGPSLSFSTDLYKSLGIVNLLDGVPKHLIQRILGGYELVGTLSGSYAFGSASSSGQSALNVKAVGKVTNKREQKISDSSANFLKQFPNSPLEKPKPSFQISLSFQSSSKYSGNTPFQLKSITDQITLSSIAKFPLFDGFVPGTYDLLRGSVNLVGSAGITGSLSIEPTSTDTYSNGINLLLVETAGEGLLATAPIALIKSFDNPANGAAVVVGELIFAPFEDILINSLAGLGNESIKGFFIGPTFSVTVNGKVNPTGIKWVEASLSGGASLAFNFNTTEETTVLNFPVSAGVSVGPLSFNLSIAPTFSWTSPYNSGSSNNPESISAIASSSVNNFAIASSNTNQITSATVNGSLLTLTFNTPLDTSSIPSASDFTIQTQTINQTSATSSGITVFDVLISNDPTTGNGVVTLRLNQAIPYSPQFQGTTANLAGQLGVFISYDGTALEDSSNNPITDFSQLSVTNNSSQTSVTGYNPTSGTGANYTTSNQQSLIGNLEADFAQDSPPALALVTNSSTTEGQVLAVWSKEVQPIAAIAGFVNGNQIYLNFVQPLNSSSTPSKSQFSLIVNGTASTINVTNVSIESNGYVLLNLNSTIQTTDTVSLTYTPTATNQATSNLFLTDALDATLWVPDFSLDLSNTTGQNTSIAPNLLGGSAVITNGNENLITLVFNQTLDDQNTPNASQFSVISNGEVLTASTVTVAGNTVTFSVSPTGSNPLIGQGDLVTVSYTPGSTADQNLTSSNSVLVAAFTQQPITTVPLNPNTSLMAGFYTPGSSTGLSNFQNIIGTDGFNFDPAVASDQKGNALSVWVYADSSDIPNQLVPGTIYSDNDTQIINDSLNASDIYFSYWNGTQWTIAAPLAATQVGTDTNVTVAYDANSNQYIAVWLNDQSTSTTGTNTATIYWSTYNPSTNTWQPIGEVLSEASPDPLTDLILSSVNGQIALFWSETQPISYSLLTAEENPYLYLRLGEINGTTATNDGSWGSAGNGTYNGNFTLKETGALENPTTKTGDPNPAVLFTDGGNLTLNSAIAVSGSAFSIEFWFQTPSTPSAITNLVSLSGLLNTSLGFDSNNNLILNFGLGDSTSSIATNASNNPLSNNTWYYVVGTYSTQTQELSLYLNAQLIQTVNSVTFTPPTTSNLTLAGSSDAVYLDEVALYGSVLDYNPPSSNQSLTGLELINTLSGTNQIGNKYSTQYVEPLPPGPQVKYSVLNTTNSTWTSQTPIDPLPQVDPTQLADANTPTFDIVSATTGNPNGSISPNGQADTIYQISLTGKQTQTISGISVTLGGVTYAVGSSYNSSGQASSLSGNQLGVVVGDSLINTLNPQSTASSLSYTVLGQTITLNLLVDTGSGTSTEAANINVYYEPTLSNTTPQTSSFTNINPYDVNSSSFTPGGVTVLGTATVTEVNDSALALIDSGFITNTTNPAMGYVLTSADFNNDGKSDVAVGNRGYTDINGNVLNNGTIQILFGGQDVLTDSETNALTPTDLSGNPNGLLITGIEDAGQANSDYPLSMATGDVNGDGITDLVIGAPNVNNQQGVVYVIYGSSSLENPTINVTTMTASQGYVINAPSGVVAGDLFGYAVTVGNFNGNGKLDIAIGTPDANNGNGAVYVAYDGSSSVSSTTVYNGSSGEGAGFALATSHYLSGGAATFSGSTSTDDLIIGAPNYQVTVNNSWNGIGGLPSQNQGNFPDSSSISAGAVYVLTSSSNGLNTDSSYTYIGTDANTPSSNGAAQDLFAGSAVVSNGDWDGDGSLDLAISSPGTNSNNGAIYLVKGNPGNQTSSQALNTISNLIINGGLPDGQAGAVITSTGDVNDDGYEDFLITAPQGANGTGQGYVLFGSSSFLGEAGTTFELNVTSNDNKTTFLLNGNSPYQFTGAAASPVGDVNGDGVDDLMISAPNANQLYTVYGHPWLADNGSIKLANISGNNGFVTDGDLYLGSTPGSYTLALSTFVNYLDLGLPSYGILYIQDSLGKVIWHSNNTTPAVQALMQTDGNFVLYSQSQPVDQPGNAEFAVFSTGTQGNSGAYLSLATDGGLYILGSNGSILNTLNAGSANPTTNNTTLSEANDIELTNPSDPLLQQSTTLVNPNGILSRPLMGNGQDVVILGDINGDGFADVLSGGSDYGAVIIFGNSTKDLLDAAVGTDDLIVTVQGATIQQVTNIGDYNGDGLQDFGVIDSKNNFYTVLGNSNLGGLGTLSLITANASLTSVTSAETIGDYNGDGYDDLLLTVNGSQSIYKGNAPGNLSLSTPVTFTSQNNTVFNAIGDVNGDGYSDIGGGNPNSNVVGPNITGNGEATVYWGNASASSVDTTNITPPPASISGTLNNNNWGFYNFSNQQTNIAPSFAVFNGYLYMVYKSSDSDNLYIQRSADGYNWEGLTNLGSAFETSSQPSLAVFGDTLYLAFTATNEKVILAPGSLDSGSEVGVSFSSSTFFQVDGQTANSGPTLVNYNGALYVFFEASGNNNYVRYNSSSNPANSSSWNGAGQTIAGQSTSNRVGATVVGGTLIVSFLSSDLNSNSFYTSTTTDGSNWTTQQVQGQATISGPSLVTVDDTAYLFFLSSNGNGELLYITSKDQGATWSSPSVNIPGQVTVDRPSPVFFQESLLVGFAGTGNSQSLNISTSNPIYEPNQTQQFGQQLQNIGDFNGDGIADLAVLASGFLSNLGSLNNNVLENNQGAVLIYYGTTSGIVDNASPDVVLATPAPNASTSTANNQAILLSNFSGAGDINGDGYDDLLISSPNRALNSQNTTDGEILVVFGGQNSLWGTTYSATNPFNLGNITPQTSTLTLQFNQPLIATDIPSTSSFSVKNGLNTISVNGVAFNGTNEIILTLASNANISDFLAITYTQPASGTQLTYATGAKVATFTSSSSAVISTSGAPTLSLESYSEYGFMIAGLPNSQAGISLSGGGDVNGDGFSDFIIGAPGNNDNLTYTLFGSDFNNTVSQTGTIGDDVMLGSPTGESFLAGQGDDKIYGKGGLDVVYAGPGDDYVTVTDTYFQRLDGGAGTDLLAFTGYNGQDWDLTTLSPGLRLRNFEILVTEDYGANTLTLNSLTVAQLSSNNTLTLAMDDADTLNLSSDFSAAGTVYQYNQKFYKYTSSTSAATVLVNKGGSRLILNEQGSLVLLSALGEQLWIAENESGNPVTGAVQALMQTDGNFVLYSQAQPLVGAGAAQYALWASNTAGNPGAYLALSNEGGLYVKNSSGAIITALNSMSGDTSFSDLNGGDELLVNQFLGSPFLITQNAPNTNIPKLVLTAETNTTQSMAIAASFATQSKEISTPETQLFANSVTTKGLASNAPTQLFVSNPTGAELDGSLDFTIQRTGDLSKSVLVSYITQDGDGKAGDRYLPVVGQFVFAPNETSKTVTVKIPNNGRFVGDRQFGLLVSLVKEGNDLAELPLSFHLEADANGSQIRRWSMIKNDTQKGLLGGTLQFDTTVSNGQAQINLSVSDIGDFNSFYSYNSQTSTYEELMLNASSTGATFTYSPQKQNDTPDGIQLNLIKDGDRGDVDNIVNGLAKTNGYAGRTIPGLITNNNKTFWAPTTADGQVQWRLIGAPTKNYELGWILVDDQNGMINGLNPTDTGYEAAALARKQVIFQDQNSASNKALTRTLAQESFTNPSDLAKTESQFFGNLENSSLEVNRFYMLYTTEGEKTTFSVTDTPEIQTDSRGYHQLSFNGITAEIGSSTLVIPGVLNQSVQMEASLSRAAAYNNLIALYRVDSLTGALDTNGDKLIDFKPGDQGYTQAALERAIDPLTGVSLTTPENLGTTQQTINLLGNNMYGMVIIPNATIEQVLNQNPSNNPNLGPIALFSFGSANPDGISHTARLGSNLFGFEDLLGGGDQDYNDMILQIKIPSLV